MILTEIHHNSAGRPIRYQVAAHTNDASYRVTVSKPTKINDKIKWTDCEYWTYEDILRIQKMLPIAVERIKEFYDDHERLVANAEWMEG